MKNRILGKIGITTVIGQAEGTYLLAQRWEAMEVLAEELRAMVRLIEDDEKRQEKA